MLKPTRLLGLLFSFLAVIMASGCNLLQDKPRVSMETTMGTIVLELDPQKAPKSVENFLHYVHTGTYNGTIFHRVIKNFMNQGGGFTADLQKKETVAPVENEAHNGLKNVRGSIAMARTNQPHSATNQFFINTADNAFLDHKDRSMRGWGYAVFGKVVSGMDVVDAIANVKTGARGPFSSDVPLTDVVIIEMRQL